MRARRGESYAIHVPADANIGEIKEGSRYRVRYSESVATEIEPGTDPTYVSP